MECDIKLKIPQKAYIEGLGRVQVLSYHGNGYWMVLTNRDMKYLKHRDAMTMVK